MNLNNDIHNYYEKLLLEHLVALGLDQSQEPEYLADLCCISLNLLPPRYIRYAVDMAFYLPQNERIEMEIKVKEALARAQEFLAIHHD